MRGDAKFSWILQDVLEQRHDGVRAAFLFLGVTYLFRRTMFRGCLNDVLGTESLGTVHFRRTFFYAAHSPSRV